jgi:hypothetical protein
MAIFTFPIKRVQIVLRIGSGIHATHLQAFGQGAERVIPKLPKNRNGCLSDKLLSLREHILGATVEVPWVPALQKVRRPDNGR